MFSSVQPAAASPPMIRVLVLKAESSLSVMGAGAELLEIEALGGDAVTVNGKKTALPLTLKPTGEFVYINGRPYRGVCSVGTDPGGLSVINALDMESYLIGGINNEISSKWPVESVKAQAVVARTYAMHQMETRTGAPYDIEGSVMGQVYGGAASEDGASAQAVFETAGEILTFAGEPALTVYHSNAGGMTDSSEDIWAEYYPYLLPVTSRFDKYAPRYAWDFSLPANSLKSLLDAAGYHIGVPVGIKCDAFTPAKRVKSLVIKGSAGRGVRLRGEDLRKIIGYSYLRSALFTVVYYDGLFVFKGTGSGHGVGMSQWGAKGMAENGFSYREILKHFYRGTTLEKAY